VPWCEDCARFWNPNSLPDSGACPTCGRPLAPAARTPWHFRLLVAAVAAYLALRAWQGVVWVARHLSV
jgi:hypothetical protein